MMDIAELLNGILNKNMIDDVELAKANHLTAGETELEQQEKIIYELKADEEAAYHHTYQEERQLLDCVREGRVEDVHMKAREKKISFDKVNELMELLENRREGEYLRALLTE